MIKEILEELIETAHVKGNRDPHDKKLAIKKAKLKKKAMQHCPDKQTPHIVGHKGELPVYKCKKIDLKKSKLMKKAIKKVKHKVDYKKSKAKASDTRKFRAK